MNKRGEFVDNVVVIGAIAIGLAVIMFIAFFIFIALPYVTQASGTLSSKLIQGTNTFQDKNVSNAVQVSVGNVDKALQNLNWIAYMAILGAFFGGLIFCFTVRLYPWMIILWIGAIIVLALLAILINSWYLQAVIANPNVYVGWEDTSLFMQYLPHIIVSIGIIYGIIMFVLITRDQETELGVQ